LVTGPLAGNWGGREVPSGDGSELARKSSGNYVFILQTRFVAGAP